MPTTVAELLAKIGIDDTKLRQGLEHAHHQLEEFGSEVKELGKGVSEAFDIALAGITDAVLESGNKTDEAFQQIIIKSGATGQALEGLKGNFKEVYGEVTQGADVVGAALGTLSARSGLTGKALAELTKQSLDLARMQGTDVASTIQTVTRVFGDASIAADKQAEAMDFLFRVSQKTGTTVQSLGEKMVFYGAPLRQMGIGWQQSAVLMGKWEKEGVNTELVMGSMRIALMKFSNDGIKEPAKALPILIEKIKEAKTQGEATAIAMTYFGARAGADMAAAVREGRFAIGDLVKAMKQTGDGIERTSAHSKTLIEKFEELRHKVELVLAPIGQQLTRALGDVIEKIQGPLISGLKQLIEWWDHLSPTTKTWAVALVAVVAAIGPVIFAVGALATAFGAILPGLGLVIGILAGPFGIALAGAAVALWAVTGAGAKSLRQFQNNVLEFWAWLKPTWTENWNAIKQTAQAIWILLEDVIGGAVRAVTHIITAAMDLLNGDWSGAWDEFKLTVSDIWQSIVDLIMNFGPKIVAAVKSLWNSVRGALTGGSAEAQKALSAQVAKDSVSGISDGVDKAAKSDALKQKVRALYDMLPKYQANAQAWAHAAIAAGGMDQKINAGLDHSNANLVKLKSMIHEGRDALVKLGKDGGGAANEAAEKLKKAGKAAEDLKSSIGAQASKAEAASISDQIDKHVAKKQHAGQGKQKLTEVQKETRALAVLTAQLQAQYDALASGGSISLAKLQGRFHALHLTAGNAVTKLQAKIKDFTEHDEDLKRYAARLAEVREKLASLKGMGDGMVFKRLDLMDPKQVATLKAAEAALKSATEAKKRQTEADDAHKRIVRESITNYQNLEAELLKLTHARFEDQESIKLTGKLYDDLDPKKDKEVIANIGRAAAAHTAIEDQKALDKKNKESAHITEELTKAVNTGTLALQRRSEAEEEAAGKKKSTTPFASLSTADQGLEREEYSLSKLDKLYEDLTAAQQAQVDTVLANAHALNIKAAADAADAAKTAHSTKITEELTVALAEANNHLNHVETGHTRYSTLVNKLLTEMKSLTAEQIAQLKQLMKAEDDITKEAKTTARMKKIVDTTKQMFDGLFMDLETGSKNAFQNLVQNFTKMLQQMAAQYLASQVTKMIFGALGVNMDGTKLAGARAMGGSVDGGKTYLVGEHGPELFRPPGNGSIVPNHQLAGAGGGGVTIHLNVQAADVGSFQNYSRGQAASDLAMAMQVAQRRNNG